MTDTQKLCFVAYDLLITTRTVLGIKCNSAVKLCHISELFTKTLMFCLYKNLPMQQKSLVTENEKGYWITMYNDWLGTKEIFSISTLFKVVKQCFRIRSFFSMGILLFDYLRKKFATYLRKMKMKNWRFKQKIKNNK